jgi:PAS domain-containing protein
VVVALTELFRMPMSEEDEVFLERSFQRTLIVSHINLIDQTYFGSAGNQADFSQELEKLISYSATPTAVWRRTGEVVYANPEFCTLVGRQGKDLMGGRTYIYRLFAKSS